MARFFSEDLKWNLMQIHQTLYCEKEKVLLCINKISENKFEELTILCPQTNFYRLKFNSNMLIVNDYFQWAMCC